MKAADFDKAFDEGADIDNMVDWSSAKRPNIATRRVNVDFPSWVVEGLDRRARLLGVTRQSLIKLWIAERLQRAMRRCKYPRWAVYGGGWDEGMRILDPFRVPQ